MNLNIYAHVSGCQGDIPQESSALYQLCPLLLNVTAVQVSIPSSRLPQLCVLSQPISLSCPLFITTITRRNNL